MNLRSEKIQGFLSGSLDHRTNVPGQFSIEMKSGRFCQARDLICILRVAEEGLTRRYVNDTLDFTRKIN